MVALMAACSGGSSESTSHNGGEAGKSSESSGGSADNGGQTNAGGTAGRGVGGNSQSGAAGSSSGGVSSGGRSSGGVSSGGRSSGGVSSGGRSSGGTSGSGSSDITAMDLVKDMKLGWNLGNTMDSTLTEAAGEETSWGNPVTTQAMMDKVKEAGFNTVRIPVTWAYHFGSAPSYTIDGAWLDRVEAIANYVLSDGMYAIVNMHHEDSWVSLMPDADHATITDEIAALWTQIANRFKDYDDHLLFETLNEPRTTDRTEWTGGTPEARAVLNQYNAAAVDAIRATGGNNAQRFVMIPTHAANASTTCINDLVIPNDDPRIIVSLHTYYPNTFSMGTSLTDPASISWGSAADQTAMEEELDRIYDLLPAKGRAVIIGEWGSVNKNNTDARATHAGAYVAAVRVRGMLPIWWDNGGQGTTGDGFGLLDRENLTWAFQSIVTAMTDAAASRP